VVRYHRLSHKDKSSSLDAFACHDYAAICASGSPKPFIELFDHTGMTLETIRYHVGFLGVRLSPVTALAFHPHKLLLCAGFAGPSLSVFAGPEANTSARR
jgi:regulator-associated protein of mTOR